MDFTLGISNKSLIKREEELCGDTVNILHTEDSDIVILSDGMGSGVKANILSTLTASILGTMLKNGDTLEDSVETVAMTLPICRERQVAYSTFAILQIYRDGHGYLAEYDTPACIVVRDGQLLDLPFTEKEICGKTIREYDFVTQENDYFVMISDGVTHAGVGGQYSFGWGRSRAAEYARELGSRPDMTGVRLTGSMIARCGQLYEHGAGDDTTVVTARVLPRRDVNLMTGPATRREDDARMVGDFMASPGLHAVSGGTSATVLARELGRTVRPSLFYDDPEIPPTAEIDGIDLVTEGVLTLNRTCALLAEYQEGTQDEDFFRRLDAFNGGSQLARLLIEQGTHIHLFVGQAMNPAHQEAGLPFDLSIRMRLVDRIVSLCREMGKDVSVTYY